MACWLSPALVIPNPPHIEDLRKRLDLARGQIVDHLRSRQPSDATQERQLRSACTATDVLLNQIWDTENPPSPAASYGSWSAARMQLPHVDRIVRRVDAYNRAAPGTPIVLSHSLAPSYAWPYGVDSHVGLITACFRLSAIGAFLSTLWPLDSDDRHPTFNLFVCLFELAAIRYTLMPDDCPATPPSVSAATRVAQNSEHFTDREALAATISREIWTLSAATL